MPTAQKVPGRAMRDLALTILGRNAEKQIQSALNCSEAQAHRIVQHDRCPNHLRQALIDFLETACAFAQRRLGAADDDLKRIRYQGMVGRAESRRVAAHREADPPLPGLGARPEKSLLGTAKKPRDRIGARVR